MNGKNLNSKSFAVERGADGSRVIYWYHRQFIEAAQRRYCSDSDKNKAIHKALADFFAGTWSKGNTLVHMFAASIYEPRPEICNNVVGATSKTPNQRSGINTIKYHT